MQPDSFKLQLQAILTTYYEDIKRVQGTSGCHKTRIVKPLFEDQEDDTCNEGADAAYAVAGASTAVLPGATPALALRAPAAVGRSLQLLHLPPALSGRRGHGVLRRRLLRLLSIKLVCLNLNRRDTRQQPDSDPAYRQASRANKKAGPKGYISVHTLFNNVCTLYVIYVAICTQNISCTYVYIMIRVCKQEIGNLNRHHDVCTCMYMMYMFI
jgi:hypothetical protein